MYANGESVVPDYVCSHMWFNIAASNGYITASEFRELVAKEMTVDQITKTQNMAQECEKKNINCTLKKEN